MSEKIARILESKHVIIADNIKLDSGYGKLPSICPICKGPLDFGPVGGPELVCRKKCGYEYEPPITHR